MKRAIIVPAAIPVAALDELKHWLAITGNAEDAFLEALLRASLEMCEDFTGVMPLVQTCEEILPPGTAWQRLTARPVSAIELLIASPQDGADFALDAGDYEFDIDAGQVGRVRLLTSGAIRRLRIHYEAGLASAWSGIPDGLRQGMLRLAAFHYRERDGGDDTPPASVAALWRPWRGLRLT